jgi:TolA-binding protein
MKKNPQLRRPTMSTTMQVAIIAVGVAAVAVSYHALRTAQDNNADLDQRLGQLQQQLTDTRTRVDALAEQFTSASAVTGRATIVDQTVAAYDAPVPADSDGAVIDSLLTLEGAVSRLEEIVDVSGVEGIATNREVDPQMLKAMVGEYSERRRAQENRDTMRERFQVSTDQEFERHGEELQSLFERSRMRFGRRGNDEDRQAAFTELQEKYPDSYATAVAIGEQALGAAFRRDLGAVEQYHQQLEDHQYGASVSTEWGVEVTPSVKYYLANQYIRDGRYGEAEPLLESLEEDFASSYVFTTGRRRMSPEDRFQPVSRAVSDLRARAEEGR